MDQLLPLQPTSPAPAAYRRLYYHALWSVCSGWWDLSPEAVSDTRGTASGHPGSRGSIELLPLRPASTAPLPRAAAILNALMDGLTAASGAAARAGHDFYKVIVRFPAVNSLHQLPGVTQAADDSHPNIPAPGMRKTASFQCLLPRTSAKASGSGFFPVTR